MKKYLEKILKHIVANKDLCEVEQIDGSTTTLVIRVAGEDYGRIVGQKGRTINLISYLVETYGKIHNKPHRCILEEPQTKEWGKRETFTVNMQWNPEEVLEDLQSFINLFSLCNLSVVVTGSNVIFECKLEAMMNGKRMEQEVKEGIKFLALAMCKGYGRNGLVDFHEL